MAGSIKSYIFSPVFVTAIGFKEANVAVSVSATGLKGEARQVSCFASTFHQNFRFCKAWHAYPTDNLDLSQMHSVGF